MNSERIAAISAQMTIKPRPYTAWKRESWRTIIASTNPNAYAAMSKNPVQTVSSIGKVSSVAKSIDTGIIGTKQNAASSILIETISRSFIKKVPIAIATSTKEPHADMRTIMTYFLYFWRRMPAETEDMIPTTQTRKPRPDISALLNPIGPKS
jgi:hypothetical protein